MICRGVLKKLLKDNNYSVISESNGINISCDNNEVLISGSSYDLVELASYLVDVSLSSDNDHIHLDNLTIVSDKSSVKNIIIEKK